MTPEEFEALGPYLFEFITYMDDKYVGSPHTEWIENNRECYIIPKSRLNEYNTTGGTIEEKLAKNILIKINPDVIDLYTLIR